MNFENIQDQLISACCYGKAELIKKLIKEGAKVNEPDARRIHLPIETAIMCESSIDPLMLLIQHGVNVNTIILHSPKQMTPLHFAIDEMCGVRDLNDTNDPEPMFLLKIKLLVENGADLNAVDKRGFKPVDYLFIKMIYTSLYSRGKDELLRFWRNILKGIIPNINYYLVDSSKHM